MRQPKYLSPTSLKLWERDQEEFYITYLSEIRLPRPPQTQPMSVGSAFDARAKSFLYGKLVGENEKYEFQSLFESQVEPHNRDWALGAGEDAFKAYKLSGALGDLMIELETATTTPRFEFDVRATIAGVPILGKPDIYFIGEGIRVILDWKVTGFCAVSKKSPTKCYINVRDGFTVPHKASRNRGPHKDVFIENFNGIRINSRHKMEEINDAWALQCTLYAWALGEEPGSEQLVIGIDELCGPRGEQRIASHRNKVGYEYQMILIDRIKAAWAGIKATGPRPDLDERIAAIADAGELGDLINEYRNR